MGKIIISKSWAAFLLLVLAVGCSPVDRWRVFEKETPVMETPPAEVQQAEDRYAPEMESPPGFKLPEGGGPVELSLEQAVMLAIENNRNLHVQKFGPVTAGAFEKIERGVFDPEVFAGFEYQEQAGTETSRATGDQYSAESAGRSAAAGVRQLLPTGTEIEAVVEQGESTSDRAPDQSTARAGLSVTQSLLKGFGPAVNLAGVRQAEFDTMASIYELKGFAQNLVADTEIAYWNYVLAKEEINIYERSLKVARQQRDEILEQIEVGFLPETEAAAARAEVALRRQALIDAESLLEESRLRLLYLIGAEGIGWFEREIRASADPRTEAFEPLSEIDNRVALARRMRPDLAEARLRHEQGRLETVVTKNGLLPRLELFAAMGKTGYGESFSGAIDAMDEDTYDFNAGVRLSHYLRNRSAKGRHEAAWAERQRAAAAVENLDQLTGLDVRMAANEAARAVKQISASAATRKLQEKAFQAEKERFFVGAGTSLLVAQAQRDLLAARIAEIEAVVECRIAMVRLYLAEGSLLERRGIDVGSP